MNRPAVLIVALATLVAAVSLAWVDVRQAREFRRLIAAGDAAIAGNQTSEAIEAFSGAVALKGQSMLPYVKRGDTYRRRGELNAALRDLRQASALDPTAARPLELQGDVYAAMEQPHRAAELYQQYLQLDDRAPAVLYKLGLAHYRAGRPDRAIDSLRRAIALNDRRAEAYYAIGMAYRGHNQPEEALRSLTRALAIDATFAAARQELADLLADLGHRRDSIEQLEALSALEPQRPERLVSVGLAYSRAGRHDDAILTLNRAAERHPGSPLVSTALGRAWLEMAESGTDLDTTAVVKAIAALRETARRPDASGETLALYGRALLMSGNPAAAEQALQQAVSRLPIEPVAFRYLADAATRLGHASIAREAEARFALLSSS
jgi:tetratricopeptide (TPR) repeat protein